MGTQSALQLEAFQSLLANAFAIQESGIDTQALSVYVEFQRLIARRELDVDHVLRLVAECVRKLANATGVAIALLKADQLVYRAGNGSAAKYVGRHVSAVLSISPHKQLNEILRVENADTDTRIEAEVCRQFGAQSLLIVPIYREHVITGVLEVLFSDAHTFQDQELRTYRLMAGLVNEVIFPSQVKATGPLTTTVPDAIKKMSSQIPIARGDPQSARVLAERPRIAGFGGSVATLAKKVRFLYPFAKVLTTVTHAVKRALDIPWNVSTWKIAAAGSGVALIIVSWFVFDRCPPSSMNFPAERANAGGQQVLPMSGKAPKTHLPRNPRVTATGTQAANLPRSTFKGASVAQNEVDYIAEDVTVRHFWATLRPSQVLTSVKEVDFGDDVTIRYFTHPPRSGSKPQSGSKTPSVSPVGQSKELLLPMPSSPGCK